MGVFTDLVDVQIQDEEFNVFKNLILSNFGSPFINVELSDEILQSCLVKSLHYVNLYCPHIVYPKIVLTSGVCEYILPYPKIKSVIDCYLEKSFFIINNYPIAGLMYPDLNISKGSGGAADFLVDYLDFTTARDVFGFKKFNVSLIQPNIVRILPQMTITVGAAVKCTIPHEKDLSSLDTFLSEWIIRYSSALCGRILARIRGKYNIGLPIGDLSGDTGNILSESIELEGNLIIELKNYGKARVPESVLVSLA
jgi:hypothetical protein